MRPRRTPAGNHRDRMRTWWCSVHRNQSQYRIGQWSRYLSPPQLELKVGTVERSDLILGDHYVRRDMSELRYKVRSIREQRLRGSRSAFVSNGVECDLWRNPNAYKDTGMLCSLNAVASLAAFAMTSWDDLGARLGKLDNAIY